MTLKLQAAKKWQICDILSEHRTCLWCITFQCSKGINSTSWRNSRVSPKNKSFCFEHTSSRGRCSVPPCCSLITDQLLLLQLLSWAAIQILFWRSFGPRHVLHSTSRTCSTAMRKLLLIHSMPFLCRHLSISSQKNGTGRLTRSMSLLLCGPIWRSVLTWNSFWMIQLIRMRCCCEALTLTATLTSSKKLRVSWARCMALKRSRRSYSKNVQTLRSGSVKLCRAQQSKRWVLLIS